MSTTTGKHPRLLVPILDTQAALGGIGRTKVYALVNAGELIHVNIGRRGFITADSIAAYVERLKQGQTGAA